jgi:DnaJ-class molecular chaperone
MTNATQDFYSRLGLSKTATPDEIKKAYRKLARKCHPDLHPGEKKAAMEKQFKELNEAYEVLGDEETRKKYDKYGAQWKEAEAYEQARQQAGATGTGGGWHTEYTQGDPRDFSDLFENIFGKQARSQGGTHRGFAIPGADLEANVQLTLHEVFAGTSRHLEIPEKSGKVKSLEVRIPKGVRDGERVRVKGKGQPGQNGGPPGDLYMKIHVTPHPVFHRTGADLSIELPLYPWEAALGTEVQVPTLTSPVRLKIPPGSQSKQKMRVKGKGLPNRTGGHGDQFVILTITNPPSLSDQERALYEQLQKLDHPDPRAALTREATHA